MSVETDLLPPRYRGPLQIGRGGMGEIYRATDESLGRAVAVKVLARRYADDEGVRRRFTREALAAARLSAAPNTVTIYDVGEWNERPFIVMEYLSGGSLEEKLRDGPVPPGQALAWLEQAARALDAAHAEGAVHRDVKPANLLLDREGNVHVADFGIASAAGMDSLTATGTVLGTAGYLSPEQAQGDRATAASDRYALAVVAFELLTGSRPFEADSTTAEAAAHVYARVPSVCDRRGDLPCELDPVFEQALAKDPRDRYETGADFVVALRHALDEAAGMTGLIAPTRPRPATRRAGGASWRAPVLGAILLAAVIGAIAGAIVATRGGHPSAAPVTVTHRVTGAGSTVVRTTSPPAPAGNAHALTDQATALMRDGSYAQAAQLAAQAARELQGKGPADPYEAYANYDAGYALYHQGRCSEAVPYLQKAQQLEPQRHEPRFYLKKAQKC